MGGIMPVRSAVLVIDMASDFINAGGVIADAGGPDYQKRAQSIVLGMARLLAAARDAGVTVIYATDAHTPEDTELRKWPPHSMRGTPEAAIVAGVAPQPGDIVLDKTTYSPFLSTELDAILRKEEITRLYITGLHTDCCARHTSGDAFQKGYDLVWVTDAMQAFTDEAHQAGLEYFKAWYASDVDAQFRTVEQLVNEWSREPATV
jgi:nicotinamidase-related amidase